jgi:hypothetical protein
MMRGIEAAARAAVGDPIARVEVAASRYATSHATTEVDVVRPDGSGALDMIVRYKRPLMDGAYYVLGFVPDTMLEGGVDYGLADEHDGERRLSSGGGAELLDPRADLVEDFLRDRLAVEDQGAGNLRRAG